MSEEKQVAILPYHDFTVKDLETIDKFKENGLVGLHTLTDVDVERSMALYLDGKTYRDIAKILKVKKDVILFLASKFKWFELRKDYLDELHATIQDKIVESKLTSQEFLLDLILVYKKKIGKNIGQYLKTDSENFADKIDVKDINTVLKIMEMVHKLDSQSMGKPGDQSLVGLNGLGEGMTITQTGPKSVEITPKASPVSSKLKQFADFKREQEKANQPSTKSRDIIDVDTPTEKESEKK